jgi:signal transduction histidine kinase
MSLPPQRRSGHGSLFRRVYLHGLLLLLVVMVAVGAVGWALNRGSAVAEPWRLARYAADRVAELADRPERLDSELRRARDAFGVQITVFGRDGGPVATNVEPPLAPLAPEDVARLRDGPLRVPRRPFAFAAPVASSGGYLVVAGAARSPHLARAALFIGVVLLALAVGSIPLARSIAAPLERLTRAARALGGGDLSARANLRAGGEVGDLAGAFDEMAERLERLVRSERELLANVSHELRTPLARVRVALELAQEGDHENAARHLAGIAADLDAIEALVGDILAAARLDAGALPLRPERVDLAALLGGMADRFRADHPDRTLDLEVAGALPPVDGDPALLRRLLANLLDNARKYSEPPSPLTIAARPDARGVAIEVRDRGIGIDAADLPRLFTPFFRTDQSRARGSGGVGLGLALAKRIAEAHGGTIAAESAPGEGTTVRVTLPPAA